MKRILLLVGIPLVLLIAIVVALPFVVDVNANPDLSLDAGFMTAAARAQITPHEAIRMITSAAMG